MTTNSSQHATPASSAVSQVANHEGTSPALPSSDGQSIESHQIYDVSSEETPTGRLEVSLSRFQPERTMENEMTIWDPPLRPIITGFNMPAFQDNLKQQMIREAQQALQSALANAAQAVPMSNPNSSSNGDMTERLEPPSPEFLAWMLQGKASLLVHEEIKKQSQAHILWYEYRHWRSQRGEIRLGLLQTCIKVDLEAHGPEPSIK